MLNIPYITYYTYTHYLLHYILCITLYITYYTTNKCEEDPRSYFNATYAVAKRKPEKNQACRDSNPDLCDTSAALSQ